MRLLLGDCLERLKDLPDNSIDSIVTDPPYGLSFMGKKWDYDVPSEDVWRECLRVLKPGGHLLAFAGTRTQHRMAVRIEDAGFEIRDMIAWIYGSGFPKSLNIGKAVDKLQGNEREDLGQSANARPNMDGKNTNTYSTRQHSNLTKGTSPYEGWGTALKPALEPITVARKPLGEKTVAENVLTHGTGGINIDGCRVKANGDNLEGGKKGGTDNEVYSKGLGDSSGISTKLDGRFPANLIHDGSEEVVGLFPETKTNSTGKNSPADYKTNSVFGAGYKSGALPYAGDSGSAARFFYCAKASKKDRDEGLEGFENTSDAEMTGREDGSIGLDWNNGKGGNAFAGASSSRTKGRKNAHPTVKPTDLMRYLCRLVTPPGGTVLDPFTGSGSTGKAALLEGFDFIGIERDYEYYQIAAARINAVDPKLFAA